MQLAFLHDLAMAGCAFVAAVYLKMGVGFLEGARGAVLDALLFIGVIAAGVFYVMRLHRSFWCYISLQDMISIAKAVTLLNLIFVPVWVLTPELSRIPLSVLVINWLVLFALLAGPRLIARLATQRQPARTVDRRRYRQIPLLLVGTGDNTELFLRALDRDAAALYRVVGIVDEMGAYLRGSIHGVEVLGRIDEIKAVVERLDADGNRPQRLVVTEDGLSPAAMRSLLDEAAALGMTLSRTPKMTELTAGVADHVEVKPVAIEDLLGRPEALLDRASMAEMIQDARVLVTGAGGTIGSELVRQISDFGPAHVVLMDNAELHLYEIDMELSLRHPALPRSTVMADVRDAVRVREIMRRHTPDLVFHAAAMKHVPMVEMNPCEGMLTNILGTRNVVDASVEHGVKAMVLISTDKAVNPTNVMGTTKRIAESYCQSLDMRGAETGCATRFLTVRFGNVLGSTGSVVPLFQRQLAAGGPITVTDPEVTRYFMTVSEAVGLVLQASALGSRSSDRKGTIFVLEMGEPVRIRDLATQMIRLAGRVPGKDIEIVYTGLRPGEKLYEEPLHESEELRPTEASGILLAAPRVPDHQMLMRLIDELIVSALNRDVERAMALLRQIVPEFQPPAARLLPPAASDAGEEAGIVPSLVRAYGTKDGQPIRTVH
jgi:O-antigen biosynthesis protein WbqV